MELWPTPPPLDAREFLSTVELLRDLDSEALNALLPELEWLRAPGGTVLFWQGEPGDAMYFVYSGRMRVSVRRGDKNDTLAEIGRGQPIGEIGLLTREGRSATVRAIRDTHLVRFKRDTFERLLQTQPKAALPLARVVAERLIKAQRRQLFQGGVSTIAIAGLGNAKIDEFLLVLMRNLNARTRCLLVTPDLVVSELGRLPEVTQVIYWLDQREAQNRLLVIQVDLNHKNADLWLRQADRILLVADPKDQVSIGPARTLLAQLAGRGSTVAEELVLYHDGEPAAGVTAPWLTQRPFAAHHHVRRNKAEDFERLARWLLGRSVGLVFGGGGARTFAHIGAIRAIREAGLPIDRVGGASMGAIIAAQFAAGWDVHRMLDENRKQWKKAYADRGLSLSLISLFPGNKPAQMLENMFGSAQLEDLLLPFFTVSVSLTSRSLVVHRRGALARWIRAATAGPGLQPPVVGEIGELHIDGGVVNNLPVDVMRSSGDGPVIAVKLSQSRELRADASLTEAPSSISYLTQSRSGPEFPDMVKILHRTAEVTSQQREQDPRNIPDLSIEPPLENFGSTDYQSVDQMERIGYECARPAIKDFMEKLRDLL